MTAAGLAELAHTLRVDGASAEVLGALHAAGVRPVVLKGPAIAERLYPEGGRTYVDADLLIAPGSRTRTERVLARLGYEHHRRWWETGDGIEHDATWRHPAHPCVIDLHRTLPRVDRISEREVWKALAPHVVTRTLPAPLGAADVLDDAGLALLLVLHAAHHVRDGRVPAEVVEDLDRGLGTFSAATWRAAAALACELDAGNWFARGLALASRP